PEHDVARLGLRYPARRRLEPWIKDGDPEHPGQRIMRQVDFLKPLLGPVLGPLADPLFGGGDNRAQAPPQPAPAQAQDGEHKSIKDQYSADMYKQLGMSKEDFDSMDPVKRNTLITGSYAKMYDNNQDTMKWAGMAAFASDTVGLGMMGAPLMGKIPGGPDGDKIKELLAKGNAELFQDIYWQHMAFEKGGMKDLQEAAKNGDVTPEQLAAWQKVAEGKSALDAAKESGDDAAIRAANDQIWSGNGDLLKFEQTKFLKEHVYDAGGAEGREAFQKMTNL